jgi:hypothetical protein
VDFGNISDDDLDYPYFLSRFAGEPTTLREYLEYFGEDVESIKCSIVENEGNKELTSFVCWTDNLVIFLCWDEYDKYLRAISRNPS